MPRSLPPYSPRTGALRSPATSIAGIWAGSPSVRRRRAAGCGVPRDASLEVRVMRGVKPDDPPAPAEAGDAELGGVAVAAGRRPFDGGVEVGHDLRIRHLGDDLADDVHEVLVLRRIALAVVERRRHRHVAELGEAAADVLDVGVNAEDLLHHQGDRVGVAALGPRHVSGDVAVGGRNADLARGQSLAVGGDRLRRDRLDRQRETGGQRAADHEAAAGRNRFRAIG